tara:strand:+ start:1825 stop:2040 length:216 start_codon:yes stop_codon:yes gene_type:complete
MKYSKDIGINWHLRMRQHIEVLKQELETTTIKLKMAERKIKKYENNNIRTTGNGKDNNVIKLSGRIYTKGD